MHFEAKKVIVVGGSAGMGRQIAVDVVEHRANAVIIGRSKNRVGDTVAELASRQGEAWGIAAELTDHATVADVQRACRAARRGDTVGQRGRMRPIEDLLAAAMIRRTRN
jgi:NAD(P)-dependent dehydrogenase (short-subunit alcohol dehydrogenase family)